VADSDEFCLSCGRTLPDDADHCIGCGCQLLRCVRPDCRKRYPAEECQYCPFCGTASAGTSTAAAAQNPVPTGDTVQVPLPADRGAPPGTQPAPLPPQLPAVPEWQLAFRAAYGLDATSPSATVDPLPALAEPAEPALSPATSDTLSYVSPKELGAIVMLEGLVKGGLRRG
jgi:hypothetical protein